MIRKILSVLILSFVTVNLMLANAQTRPVNRQPIRRSKPYIDGGVYTLNTTIDLRVGISMKTKLIPVEEGAPVSLAVMLLFNGREHAATHFAQASDPALSTFSLDVGGRRLNPESYDYLKESSCTGTVVSSFLSFEQKDGRMGQFGSTCYPLVLKFDVPRELSKARKILEIKDLKLMTGKDNDKVLALKVRLD